MYNLRPYGSRGWPTFETSAASIVLAHLALLKRRKKSLPPLIAQAEASSLKFINIDVIDLTLQLKPNERVGATFFPNSAEPNEVVVVDPNSPAFKAGLREGDLILAVDGVECTEGMIAPKLWKDGAGRPVRELRIAPREVVVAQSPEHLLRECKKKLRSKRIFFTGKADMKVVIQLLSDFEDSIAVEFDQMRAKHLKLRTEDLERVHATELGEARRSRDRNLLQRLTSHEEPMPTLHVSTKAPEPKRASVLPDAMRLPEQPLHVSTPMPKPAVEQRYPISSSVFVKRSNGEETLAYVKEFDAVQQNYTVEIKKLGSIKLEKCDEESLRAANVFEVWFSGRALNTSRGDDSDLNA
jgi:hypothetical protein